MLWWWWWSDQYQWLPDFENPERWAVTEQEMSQVLCFGTVMKENQGCFHLNAAVAVDDGHHHPQHSGVGISGGS